MHRFTLRQQLFTYLFTHSFTYPFHLTARPAVQLKVYPSIPSRWLLCTSLIQGGADKLLHFKGCLFYFHFTERKPSTGIRVGDIQVKMKFVNRYKFFIYSLVFCFFLWTSQCFSVAWVYNLNWMWWVKTDYVPQNNSKSQLPWELLGNTWINCAFFCWVTKVFIMPWKDMQSNLNDETERWFLWSFYCNVNCHSNVWNQCVFCFVFLFFTVKTFVIYLSCYICLYLKWIIFFLTFCVSQKKQQLFFQHW